MSPRDEGRQDDLVKDLMTRLKCHSCGEHFQTESIKVIAHQDNVWFLKASCRACGQSNLTVALVSEIDQPDPVSDLYPTEKEKFRHHQTLTNDDLLDTHCFLKDFDGDFARLFGDQAGADQ